MNIVEVFKGQIDMYAPITEDIYDKIEYKRTTFNNLMEVGDRVLYFYLIPNGGEYKDRKIGTILEKNLNLLSGYELDSMEDEIIPVFKS